MQWHAATKARRTMRIAIITENFLPKKDGVTRTIDMLLGHLQERGDPAVVFAPEGSPPYHKGAQIIPVPGIPIPIYPELRFLFPRRAMGEELARFNPDIIHLADPMLLGMAGLYWGKRMGVPVVAAYHTNIADYMRDFHLSLLAGPMWRYRRFLHNQCAATLVPSPSTAEVVQRQGFHNVHLWPRGVDSVLFSPEKRAAGRRVLGVDDATRVLLYVGRLSHEKKLTVLAEAFRTLAPSKTELVLVGSGPAEADIRAALAGLPARFMGVKEGEELAQLFAAGDVFAFPSTTETFGQVVQEAMASGMPVVGCDAEGVRDLVQQGQTGLLARPNDPRDFAAALRTLLDDAPRRAAMGTAARAFAETRSWAEVMDNLLALYAEILQTPTLSIDPEMDPEDFDLEPISA
jgi:glycosyltransferase involved in cell wall biosynthesis